jgi:hypothetical protein
LDWLDDLAFTGLVHPWLRSVRVDLARSAAPGPFNCGVQLRRLHFPRLHPRLQQVIVNLFAVRFLFDFFIALRRDGISSDELEEKNACVPT